ncbi:MAG: hypothetical protein ACC707_12745 [Thiohalomonadales bacterium]
MISAQRDTYWAEVEALKDQRLAVEAQKNSDLNDEIVQLRAILLLMLRGQSKTTKSALDMKNGNCGKDRVGTWVFI